MKDEVEDPYQGFLIHSVGDRSLYGVLTDHLRPEFLQKMNYLEVTAYETSFDHQVDVLAKKLKTGNACRMIVLQLGFEDAALQSEAMRLKLVANLRKLSRAVSAPVDILIFSGLRLRLGERYQEHAMDDV